MGIIKSRPALLLFILLCLLSTSASAEKRTPPDITSIEHFFDTTNSLNVDDVDKHPNLFSSTLGSTTNFGPVENSIWIKIKLKNPYTDRKTWILDTENFLILGGEIYQKNKNEIKQVYKHANNLKKWDLNFSSPITLQGKSQSVLYIRYKTYMSTHMHLKFFSTAENQKNILFKQSFASLVCGALLIILLINLMSYFSLGGGQHIFYTLQCLLMLASTLIASGLIQNFHSSSELPLSPKIIAILSAYTVTSSIWFGYYFMGIDNYFKWYKNTALAITASIVFISLLSLVSALDKLVFFYLIPVPLILGLCLIIYTSIRLALLKVRLSRIHLFSTSLLIIGFMVYILSVQDAFSLEQLPHDTIIYSFLLMEAMVLLLAINYKVKLIRNDNELAHKKLMRVFHEQIEESAEIQKLHHEKSIAIQQSRDKVKQLAAASHDIYQHILMMRLGNKQGPVGDNIENSINYIENLTESILSISKKEAQSSHALDIQKLFSKLHQQLSPLAQAKGIALRFRCNAINAMHSEVILTRIMENLIRNAIQATNTGGVIFVLRPCAAGLRLQVFDTGPGIRESKIAKITQEFERDSSGNGFGLGLYIVSSLCRQSGYRFTMQSLEGKGTVMTVLLPNKA